MINHETVPWPVRAFAYTTPHRWMIPVFLYWDNIDTNYACCPS